LKILRGAGVPDEKLSGILENSKLMLNRLKSTLQ